MIEIANIVKEKLRRTREEKGEKIQNKRKI